MKIAHVFLIVALMASVSLAEAGVPPKYLSVPQWQSCTSTMQKGTAQFVCLPGHKPKSCPFFSWMKLKRHHMLPMCPKMLTK